MRSVTSYTVRKSALEPPTRYTIGDEALEIEPEGKPPRRVVYAELRRVTLSFVPTPVDARFFCSLRHAGGTLHLVSTNYDGPGASRRAPRRTRPSSVPCSRGWRTGRPRPSTARARAASPTAS